MNAVKNTSDSLAENAFRSSCEIVFYKIKMRSCRTLYRCSLLHQQINDEETTKQLDFSLRKTRNVSDTYFMSTFWVYNVKQTP